LKCYRKTNIEKPSKIEQKKKREKYSRKNQHNHRCNFIEQQFKNIASDREIAKWTNG